MADILIIHEGKEIEINLEDIRTVKVIEYLGGGGFADAWKVQDTSTSICYVLKHVKLKPDLKDDKDKFIQRIKNEAGIRAHSDYIVKCFGLVDFSSNSLGILFEFFSGQDFGDWIRNNKELPWEDKKQLFIEILKGVNDAHNMNIIHRDLKPPNIFITSDNKPKIIDFGIAKFKDMSVTESREMGGTLPYMDPNAILTGLKYVDCRCDIYALGIILYELIMGANPWILNDLEFAEFVKGVTSGKKHILEIDEEYNFEDEKVRNVICNCTMFEADERANVINDIITMLGDKPIEKPVIDVDFTLRSPVLIIEDGSAKGAINVLTIHEEGGVKQLGRLNLDATNNTISKNHAMIERNGNKYYLYDTNSRNGTYLNGLKVGIGDSNKTEIVHTDRLRFGDLWTRFVFINK